MSGFPVSIRLESLDQPGAGYEIMLLDGETGIYLVAKGRYTRTTIACGGIKSISELTMLSHVNLQFHQCLNRNLTLTPTP